MTDGQQQWQRQHRLVEYSSRPCLTGSNERNRMSYKNTRVRSQQSPHTGRLQMSYNLDVAEHRILQLFRARY